MKEFKELVFVRQLESYWRSTLVRLECDGHNSFVEQLKDARVELDRNPEYDSFDDGTYTHILCVYLSEECYRAVIECENLSKERIKNALNAVAGDARNETLGEVVFLLKKDVELRNVKIGDVVTGAFSEYRIVGCKGQGGNAHVFEAEGELGKFAVKVLDPSQVGVRDKVSRFKREIYGLHRITHPNVMHVVDGGVTSGGLPFYVMQLAERTLRDIIGSDLSLAQRVRYAREILAGVGELHKHGIYHRDIKPENILLIDGHAVIADIGIAHFCDAECTLTKKGDRMANFRYAAPEQRSKHPKPSAAMDLYSVSLVIQELFTGKFPLGIEHIPIASLDVTMSGWDKAIMQSMQEVPGYRPCSISEFISIVEHGEKWLQDPDNPRHCCIHFSLDRFLPAFPDTKRNPEHTEWRSVSARLKMLFRPPLVSDCIWWTNGMHNNEVTRVAFDEVKQVMYFRDMECKVAKVVPLHFSNRDWLDAVYIEVAPMPPTEDRSDASCRLCLYDGRELSSEEVEAGCFYDEDNVCHDIDRSRLVDVVRHLVPCNFLVTSKWSPIIQQTRCELELRDLMMGVLNGKRTLDDLRQFINLFQKPDFDRLDAWWDSLRE